VALFVVPALLLAACGGDSNADSNPNDDKIQVVTTLPLFADFVRNVGGDRVEVTSLLPLGADPHTFEPSPRDVEPITKADVAFVNGLDLEPGLIKVMEANLPGDAELVEFGEQNVTIGEGLGIAIPVSVDDPHAWMETGMTRDLYLKVIEDKLQELDPAGSSIYEANYDVYKQQVGELQDYMMGTVAPISIGHRKLVTTHDAFFWFAGGIGFEAVAAVAESPGQEPSPSEIADLTAAIKDQNIPAVFSEPQISEESHILEQAAADAGVQVCTLYSDSLDDKVSTYIDMMRYNADEITRCLGGD